jgi:hypothetical protein
MGVFLRLILIGFLVYFVLRTIAAFGARTGNSRPSDVTGKDESSGGKGGIPKDLGEYVDYEEVPDE